MGPLPSSKMENLQKLWKDHPKLRCYPIESIWWDKIVKEHTMSCANVPPEVRRNEKAKKRDQENRLRKSDRH